jgi:hypothetical protein
MTQGGGGAGVAESGEPRAVQGLYHTLGLDDHDETLLEHSAVAVR